MPSAVLIWIWFCAYLNCAGWMLSALHQLNAGGYAVALLIGLIALFCWRKKTSGQIRPLVCWRKFNHRFRRPFPFAFLILAAMAFLGGAIYAPNNYDGLAYRIPRVLHWLAANQWHWIHTIFPRINNRSCGIEWVSAPFVAILKTDRLLFLINLVSFSLLPGLVFSVFTRLGVRRRVAWHWMWIVPAGYGFLLQAGSIGNDLFGAPFALAVVDFALRAKISRVPRDFFASILAAALMTSAKTSNLPLLLPWAIAILPSVRLAYRWPLKTFAVCVIAVFASVLPTIVLNIKFSGDWSGARLDNGTAQHATALKFGANTVLLAIENFAPPVFPMADKWNRAMEHGIPEKLSERLQQTMESPGDKFELQQMQIEENAGFGFGVSVLLLAGVVGAIFTRPKISSANGSVWQTCVRLAPLVSLLAVMTQSNLTAIARILVPYYALLLPPLLACNGHERLVKKCWWRVATLIVFFIAAGLLIISPARPLFPVQAISGRIPNAPARVREVYSVYAARNDAFAPARAALPPDLKVLGLITYDDPETSLWRPFGSRRIEHVCPGDATADLKARGIEYILVSEDALKKHFPDPLADWLKKMDAQVVQKISLNLRASTGPSDWWLLKLN